MEDDAAFTVITIHVSPEDLAKLRFAYRPLLEISLSYRVLINPEFQSPYRQWVDESSRSLYDLQLPYLNALVPPHGYIPDFITPTPLVSRMDIHEDIQDVLATPDDIIRENVGILIEEKGDSAIRRHFMAHPREAVNCLAEEMRLYWQRALTHYWSRMVNTLESDILYHARSLALDGPGDVFDDLHTSISFRDSQINIAAICQHHSPPYEATLEGSGIHLVPVVFRGCGRMFQVDPKWQPMIAYGVRGTGLWHSQKLPHNQSLELALGVSRARILQVLVTPMSTGELARRLYITAGAASQQLGRLTKAGLIKQHRSGKRVYHQLTQRGTELLALFDRTY